MLAQIEFESRVKNGTIASSSDTFTDPRDGKVYRTVKIGEQIWMAENLAFNAPGSKCYDNDENNGKKYGRLYDWDTAMKASPPGWHLPSDDEWQTLVDFAGGEKIAGKKLKAKNGWNNNGNKSGNGTDDFSFSALPGGYGGSDGSFGSVGNYGYWWSSSEYGSYDAYDRIMDYHYEGVYYYYGSKLYLRSVRCLQDYGEAHR